MKVGLTFYWLIKLKVSYVVSISWKCWLLILAVAAGEGPGISSAGAIEEDITATKGMIKWTLARSLLIAKAADIPLFSSHPPNLVTKETPEVTNPISSVSTGSTSTLSAMTPSSSTAVSDFALSGAATPSVYIPALPMLLHYPDELCVKLLWEKTSSSWIISWFRFHRPQPPKEQSLEEEKGRIN